MVGVEIGAFFDAFVASQQRHFLGAVVIPEAQAGVRDAARVEVDGDGGVAAFDAVGLQGEAGRHGFDEERVVAIDADHGRFVGVAAAAKFGAYLRESARVVDVVEEVFDFAPLARGAELGVLRAFGRADDHDLAFERAAQLFGEVFGVDERHRVGREAGLGHVDAVAAEVGVALLARESGAEAFAAGPSVCVHVEGAVGLEHFDAVVLGAAHQRRRRHFDHEVVVVLDELQAASACEPPARCGAVEHVLAHEVGRGLQVVVDVAELRLGVVELGGQHVVPHGVVGRAVESFGFEGHAGLKVVVVVGVGACLAACEAVAVVDVLQALVVAHAHQVFVYPHHEFLGLFLVGGELVELGHLLHELVVVAAEADGLALCGRAAVECQCGCRGGHHRHCH